MAANPFDQFDAPATPSPSAGSAANPFDQFDQPTAPPPRPARPYDALTAPPPKEIVGPGGSRLQFPDAAAAAGFERSLQGRDMDPDSLAYLLMQYGGKTIAPAPAAKKPSPLEGTAPWTGIGGRGMPIQKPRSVMQGYVAGQGRQEPLPSAERYVVDPQFIQAVEAQLNAMPEQQRNIALGKMVGRTDAYGRAARDIQGRYEALNKITTEPVRGAFDPRLEAQNKRLEVEGDMHPQSAAYSARLAALRGTRANILPKAVPDVVAEQAAADAARIRQEMQDAGFARRVGAEVMTNLRQTAIGASQIYADITGDKDLQKNLLNIQRTEKARGEAIPQGDSIAAQSAQKAIANLAGQAPMMVLGAMTGTAAPVLAQAGFESFSRAYGEAKGAGKTGLEATYRAGLMSVAEIMFARYGLSEQLKAIRGVIDRVPTKDLSGYLTASFIKEIPAEQATTLSQFMIDKLPQIGLNPDAGLKDYWEQAAETLRQTVIQTGAANAAIYGASKAERTYSERVLPALSKDRALARAIEKGSERVEPTLAALRAQSVTGGLPSGRVEPTLGEAPAGGQVAPGEVPPAVPAEERVEPTMQAAPPARPAVPTIPGMPTGEEIEEPSVTNVTPKVPPAFVYNLITSPAYEGVEPLSFDDADFELEVLQNAAQRGRLTPAQFAQSEIAKRLDTGQVMLINEGLRDDPIGTINALREQLQQRGSLDQKPASEEPVTPVSGGVTFTTAKGSTYTVNPDGTTTRNKAARPEHPGEEGIQPASKRTVYVTESDANKLSEIQAQGGARRTLRFDDATNRVGMFYLDGPGAGKLEGRTVVNFQSEPAVGLIPIEYWGDNKTVHFGNPITKVIGKPTAPPSVTNVTPSAPPAPKPPGELPFTPIGRGPQFKSSVPPTAAAARLPDTPTVAPIKPIKPFEPAAPQHQDAELTPVDVPLSMLKLSNDVPQFKYGANQKGVVKPLGGKFSKEGLAPIAVWHRLDGSLEVISGRHRFDLAQRSGEKTIPAQIYYESQGFTAQDAAIKDAELNIRDDQGQVKDYVNYFKESGMDRETAESKGLLARDKGKRGFTIGNQGSDELIESLRADKVSDTEAYYIALNAPNDSRLQAVGIKAIMDGKSINIATNMMQAVKAMATENNIPWGTGETADIWEFDDSAIKEAAEMAKIAQKKQREVQDRLAAITGAVKRPEIAKAEGIDIKDPEAVKRRIEELRGLKAAWDNWATNSDIIAQIRAERGTPAPTFELVSESEAERRAREEKEAAEKEEKERKRIADQEVDLFGLTPPPTGIEEPPTGELFGEENAPSAEYQAAAETFRRASAQFRKVQEAYRKQEIGDDEFLAGRTAFDKATAEFDKATRKEQGLPEPEEKVSPLQKAYDKAKADLEELGPEPPKPSPEKRFFGEAGRAGASPELIEQYDKQVKRYNAWKRRYNTLKKKEVDAANALFRSQQTPDQPDEESSGVRGASDADVKKVADAFQQKGGSEEADPFKIFQPPQKQEIVRAEDKARVYVKGSGYMTVAEAKKRIEQWKKHADAQRKGGKNSDKVVLSLFDLTGEWSKPWEDAGYQVYRFDIQADPEIGDVRKFDIDFFSDIFGMFDGNDIYAILAACPCTDFASSGARHFKAKDADGRTIESVELVRATLATIEYFKPAIWAIENPVGRIENLTGLPPWRLSFNPNHFGDPYTKKTLLWGRFNADLPIAPVEPTEGSKMHSKYGGKSQATKNARSVTPEGFAYSFFMANNAIDHPVMALSNKYSAMDPKVFQRAIDAGMKEQEISHIIDDDYYDLDFDRAEQALDERIKEILTPKPAALYTPEQRKEAEVHANDIGGEIVWQEGDNALIRGYSVLTGDPVYVPTMGSSRARVDVERFTGAQIPQDVRQKMIAAKTEAEAEAAKKHADKPFIKFENGIALSDGIDSDLAGVIREWKGLLKLDVPIYVSTVEDARANRNNFTGPHRRIGSGTLDANELGSMRRMSDGSYYILFKESTSPTRILETIAHEMGHIHERLFFDSATPEEKAALRDAHAKFLESQKGKTAREFTSALRGRAVGRVMKGPAGQQESQLTPYWKSFGEWYADQLSKWAVSSARPVSIVEKYFKRLAIQLRRFFQQLKARKYLPDETFAQYMDRVTERPPVIDTGGSDVAERMATDVSGRSSPVTFREDIPNEDWLNGKIRYAKSRPRTVFGVPAMSSTTGYFSRSVYVPVRWLKDLKGERGEQQNVRQRDLDGIREVIRSTGQLPLTKDGKVYAPYIEIGYDGVPWVSEGNHRIMAAVAEGLDYIPIELKYFDGGQRNVDAKWKPQNILDIQGRDDIQERFDQVPLYNINEFRGPLGFYSALSAGIDGLKIASAPVQGWKDAIKGLINKGQVKADEVEWSGINDWLDLQTGKVSKQAISDYLKEGGVTVEETVFGDNRFSAIKDGYIAAMVRQGKSPGGAALLWEEMQAFAQNEEDYNEAWKNEGFDLVIKDGRYTGNEIHDVLDGTYETKYGAYTLPGGQNYREVLLTLPSKEPKTSFEWTSLPNGNGSSLKIYVGGVVQFSSNGKPYPTDDASINAAEQQALKNAGVDPVEYRSNHWDQPNVIAHIRVNDRTDADGKRVLFVEEIQSDWGQDGKKRGFYNRKDVGSREQYVAAKRAAREVLERNDNLGFDNWLDALNAIRASDRWTVDTEADEKILDEFLRAEQRELRRIGRAEGTGVPSAPFVTKTEGWLNLALKRIMVMAAEGGYDRVAFISGEQSADRYDLRKQIDYIDYIYEGPDKYRIGVVGKDGRGIDLPKETFTAAELENYVGKDVAQRIVNGEGQSGGGRMTLRGPDLKVGGEGMKTFYDTIVPTALKKLLPKVGGGQMGVVEFGSVDGNRYWVRDVGDEWVVTDSQVDDGSADVSVHDTEQAATAEANRLNRADAGNMAQPGFDVTPAMREKVAEGLPLFNVQEEPSLAEQEGEFIFGSGVRKAQIREYARLRRLIGRVPREVAAGKASIDMQRNVTRLIEASRELQASIKATAPRRDAPEDFLAKALTEYTKGNISEDVLLVIQTAYARHPELLDGLLLSVRKGSTVAGQFEKFDRIVTLFKQSEGVSNPRTIRHELTHAMEQMMLPEQRAVIVQAWGKALQTAIKKHTDLKHQDYFNAIFAFLDNPSRRTFEDALSLLPSYDMYQFINPSEYWAVNAEPLMEAQLGSAWDKFKRAMRRLFEGLKNILGFDNKYAVHKTFKDVMTGSKERITRQLLVDMIADGAGREAVGPVPNIDEEKALMDKYRRPNTPMLDNAPVKTAIIDTMKNGADVFKAAVTDPKQAIVGSGDFVLDGLLAMRIKAVWYGAGLESRDFARYGGALQTSEGAATASLALDNAIRSGNIGVEVIFRGGIEYNPNTKNFMAVERDLGMKGVYEAEAALRKRLGDQLGTNIIQGYLEAKRSISIMNEQADRQAELEDAKENLTAMQALGFDPEEIVVAKARVAELEDDLKAINKAVSSVNMSEEEMSEFADLDQKHPELRKIMDNWTAINQNLLRFWRQVGLLSQGRYDTLSKIKDYVPWYRIMNDEEDLHSSQQAIDSTTRSMTKIGLEKLFKRGRPVVVTDFTAKEGQKIFKIQPAAGIRVTVNDEPVDSALISATPDGEVKLDMDLKEGDFVVFETNREIQNIIDNMTRNVMRMTMNGIRQFAANRIVLEYATRNQEGKVRQYPSIDPARNRFNWVVNGKKVVVEIEDPLVAASIYGMENINLQMWRPMAAVANLTRRSITLSGVFQVKQVFKDAPTAAMVTGVRNPLALIGGVWKGFLTSLVQPAIKKGGVDIEPVVDILKAAGIGGFQSPARTPEAELKRRMGIMNRNVYSAVIKGLDHIGDSSDMAQRVATYKRVLAETGDEAQALFQAANVINFLHHGSSGFAQAAVKLVPFLGAYANSTDVLVNALMGGGLKGVSRRKALARLAVTTSILSSLTLLYCMLMGGDPEYDELDDQLKLRNVFIPGTKIMVPMNTSAALFFKAIPELIYNAVTREGTKNEFDRQRLRRALAEVARDSLLGPEPVPAGAKQILEIGINHNFFTGRPITPPALKDVEAAEQYVASTSELGKTISAMLAIPGTDGKRVLNPIEADHLVRGLFGTAGAMTQWISNSIGTIAETRPEPSPRERPITGSFLRDEVPRGREDLFYDLKERVMEKYSTFNKMLEREAYAEADKYLTKNYDLIAMHEYITDIEGELEEINQEARRVGTTKAKDMSPKKRREELVKLQKDKQYLFMDVKEMRRQALKSTE